MSTKPRTYKPIIFITMLLWQCITATLSPPSARAASPDVFPSHFELSGWIDLGLSNGLRGDWYDLSSPTETPPTTTQIQNAKKILTEYHHLNAIYLVTHQQFTLEDTQKTFLDWKAQADPRLRDPAIIPTLVLQNYANNIESCNYTNQELHDQLAWFQANINSRAVAIYDVYDTQHRANRKDYCNQLPIISQYYADKEIIRVGIQPGETLPSPFTRAVQDTYGGFSAGINHDSWEHSCSGKPTLISWVNDRLTQQAQIAWDLVVVGFDYSANSPCGEDRFELDHPLPPGRNRLGHDTIVSQYPQGADHPLWGGFSIDYKIINAHSLHKDSSATNFYNTLKQGTAYQGYFQSALDEARSVLALYNNNVQDTPTPLPGDLNADGKVDIFDYQRLITGFGNPYTIFDYQKVISNFGR